MPIKLPRGFARRKSAGNLVETLDTEPAESFRVLDRTEVHDYARDQRTRQRVPGRPISSPFLYNSNHSFDDSPYLTNRTNNSDSTGAASSSARHSYHSTGPSSLESTSHDEFNYKAAQPPSMAPPASFDPQFFTDDRGEGQSKFSASISRKRFSIPRPKFGNSGNSSNSATDTTRGRSHTITNHASSYADTTLPPHVSLGQGQYNADVGGAWFDGFGNGGNSQIMEEPSSFEPPEQPRPIYRSESDSLLAAKKQFSFERNDDRPLHQSPRLEHSAPPDHYASRSSDRDDLQNNAHSTGSYRSFSESNDPGIEESSPPLRDDADTQLLMDAAFASQALERQLGFTSKPTILADRSRAVINAPRSPTAAGQVERPRSFGNRVNFGGGPSNISTPRAQNDDTDSLFENSPASTVLHNVHEPSSSAQRGTKIMTPAEFERAKHDAEANRDDDDDDESVKSEESDLYRDEDESQRNREMAKQRRKQQAHLTVYRQQMMKITGEQPADLPERPTLSRFSRSMPNFSSSTAKTGPEGEHTGKSSDDSDDEIPLGVLQAHGFPNRSRPPTRLADHTARPSTQLSSYPAPPGSTRNDPSAGGGGSGALPPFARHLPADPYVGASLVNQSNRASLQYNSPTSPTGNPQAASAPLPPGGLVGVIAGEERARAMRRGSPNTNGVYAPIPPQQPMANPAAPQHQMQQQQIPNPMNNMLYQQQFSPNEQAQMEITNSMTQMMHVQMQWMQQMMQLQAMSQQTGTPMPQMPPMPPMPLMAQQMMQQQAQAGAQQNNFLNSQPLQALQGPESASNFGPGHQRTTSRMSNYGQVHPAPSTFGVMPAMSGDGIQGAYAPSIAPSERSNVGQPSRYRPVTPSAPNSARTSTLSQSTAAGAPQSIYDTLHNPRARSPVKNQSQLFDTNQFAGYHHNASRSVEALDMGSTIRAVSKPKRGTGGESADASDDEDDAGWAEMRRKREERKSRWRPRRDTVTESQRHEQESVALEGLYYNGPSDD